MLQASIARNIIACKCIVCYAYARSFTSVSNVMGMNGNVCTCLCEQLMSSHFRIILNVLSYCISIIVLCCTVAYWHVYDLKVKYLFCCLKCCTDWTLALARYFVCSVSEFGILENTVFTYLIKLLSHKLVSSSILKMRVLILSHY